MWASVQTLSDAPSYPQAVPSNGGTRLTFRGRASWWAGNAGSARSSEQKRKGQKPRRENEAPPARPPATASHCRLHAGRSVNTVLSNFPQAQRYTVKPLCRAGMSFLFSRQNLPPRTSARGLAGPPQRPTATPPVTGGLCLRGAVVKRPSPPEGDRGRRNSAVRPA